MRKKVFCLFMVGRKCFGFWWFLEPKQAKPIALGEFYNYLLALDPNKREDVAHGAQVMIFMYSAARPDEVYNLRTRDVYIGNKAAAVTLRDRKNNGLVKCF